MADEIFEKVKKIVVEKLGVNESEVVESASFFEDLAADSLDVVDLVMSLESEFGLEIPDDAVDGLKTVGDVITYVRNNVQQTA